MIHPDSVACLVDVFIQGVIIGFIAGFIKSYKK